jgi:hypothetical protein
MRLGAVAAILSLALLARGVVLADTASERLARYRPAVDAAVDRALAWLARTQQKDGTFPGRWGRSTAVVGLSGMAFLAKGYTPASKRYGDAINRCVDFICEKPRPNGMLDGGMGGEGGMYAHLISTLFLSEVSGMVSPRQQAKIDSLLPGALKLILDAQNRNSSKGWDVFRGGWRYKTDSRDSDISVSGWALMTLRSARLNGAPIPKKTIDDAIAFILRCRHNGNGGFRYMPRWHPQTGVGRTGVALLCLELCGHRGTPVTKHAGDYILRHIKDHGCIEDRHYHYALYYCSQGMFQLGGKYWETFAAAVYDNLLKAQKKDGHWDGNIHGGWRYKAYPTAMNVLALSIVYRQLPIYQR